MSLNLKCILNWNLQGVPFFTKDLNVKQKIWKQTLANSLPTEEELEDNDLVVVCIDNLFGYRCGLIGYILMLISSNFSYYLSNSTLLNRCVNYVCKSELNSNDFEILAGVISVINRSIPLLNYGVWDHKEYLKTGLLKYINQNHSMSSMFSCESSFLFKPFFDSGLCILSNKECNDSGFEKLNNQVNRYINEGFLWCYYNKNNKGVLIININLSRSSDSEIKTNELKQLENLCNTLTNKFSNVILDTYIIGDFVVEFESLNPYYTSFSKMSRYKNQCLLYKTQLYKNEPSFFSIKCQHYEENLLKYNFISTRKRIIEILQQKFVPKKRQMLETIEEKKDIPLKEVVVEVPEIKSPKETLINLYKVIAKEKDNKEIVNIENPLENYFKNKSDSEKELSSDEEWMKM